MTEIDLTEQAYSQWLRAGRPPFEWFLGRPDEEREAMAILGDQQTLEVAVCFGYAVQNPEAAEAGMADPEDLDAEVTLAKHAALAVIRDLTGQNGSRSTPTPAPAKSPETLAGFGARHTEEHEHRRKPRKLMGRAPDTEDP